ncbi:MAG: polymerase polymerase protein [Candidatus Parcubacteria bacterium]|jgi:DNA polymerase-1
MKSEKADTKTETKRLVLLDAHAILHRAYHALPDFMSSKGEPTGALYGLSTMLIKIVDELKPDYLISAYDLPKPTYRHEAYKDYKAGRAKADEALVAQMKRSREVFDAFSIPMYDKEGFEADDMIGTIVEQMKGRKDIEIVIASGDMDTLQLVTGKKVQVYTLKKGIHDTILYDEEAVVKRFGFGPKLLPDYKGLRGDPSDNIPGIKGIGEVTATLLIKTFGSIEQMYKALKKDEKAFEKAGLTPRISELLRVGKEDAEFSKMLGTIRRDAPITFVLPEKLWKEGMDIKKAEDFFRELEFRALPARLKEVLTGKKAEVATQSSLVSTVQNDISPKALSELLIALWVLDSNKTTPTIEDVATYAKTDSLAEAQKVIFHRLAQEAGSRRVFEDIEKPLIPIIEKMKEVGIKIDIAQFKKLSLSYHDELSALEKEIWKLAGEEFNVASPKQLGEILFVKMGLAGKRQKKTATGNFSTKESELEKIKELSPIIPLILKHRELSKLLGTYVDPLPTLVKEDGRVHATFLQAGAATGRMASTDPSLHNIPNTGLRGKAIRKAFVAEKGFKIVTFDYSQIELRIAAFLSGDKKMIDVFLKGEDIHTRVASEVFGVAPEAVTKDMRRQAKVINFGILFGMGVSALQSNLADPEAGEADKITRTQAQKFYNDYFEKFSGLATYLNTVKAEAYRVGFTETFFGRRRYFEGIKSKLPFIRAAAERMAINAPIQGTEADIIKLAMVQIDAYLKKEKLLDSARILLQVHDELVYEIKEDLVEKIAPKIRKIMEEVIDPKDVSGIVCTAEASVGDNWGELKSIPKL